MQQIEIGQQKIAPEAANGKAPEVLPPTLFAPNGDVLPPSQELPAIHVEHRERRYRKQRLIVAANRFPMNFERNEHGTLKKDEHGKYVTKPSIGGLVTALKPIMANSNLEGMYVGWTGAHDPELEGFEETGAIDPEGNKTHFIGIHLNKTLEDNYYNGFANSHLWMKYHPGLEQYAMSGVDSHWSAYNDVNHKFASRIKKHAHPGDPIFIQDYHLQLVAKHLRDMGVENPMAFFLHIPFPDVDTFATVDHPRAILEGLLSHDSIGFQSVTAKENFIDAVENFNAFENTYGIDERSVETTVKEIYDTENGTVVVVEEVRGGQKSERKVMVNAYPISIDTQEWEDQAQHPEVLQIEDLIRKSMPEDAFSIYGGSRIDPSKAPVLMQQGYRRALERDQYLHGYLYYRRRFTPSRMNVAIYKQLFHEVQSYAAETNELFGSETWTPAKVMTNEASRHETIAEYKATKAIEAGSLADGMNLTGLEGSIVNDVVVMVGAQTGIREFLDPHAVVIDPRNPDSVADGFIKIAYMPDAERVARAEASRSIVKHHNVFVWGAENVGTAIQVFNARKGN